MRLTTQVCPASFTLASPAGAIYAAKPTSTCLYVVVNNQRNFSHVVFDNEATASPAPVGPDQYTSAADLIDRVVDEADVLGIVPRGQAVADDIMDDISLNLARFGLIDAMYKGAGRS